MRELETSAHGKSATEERILAAAAGLFSRLGYNGVSTRAIASAAELNQVTIYRYYPRKRSLYLAVLAAELGRVSLRGNLLSEIVHAQEARTAIRRAFDLIVNTIEREPTLLRLVLYSSLELDEDSGALLRKHLGELVEVVAHYLEPWIAKGELNYRNAKELVLALIAIVAFYRPLHRAFGEELSTQHAVLDAFIAAFTK
jgi:AcrR family transcriptional regulator